MFCDLFQLIRFYHAAEFGSTAQDSYLQGQLSFVESISAVQGLSEKLLNTPQCVVADLSQNQYYSKVRKLGNLLQRTWQFIHPGADPRLLFGDDNDRFALAEELFDTVKTAAEFFDKSDLAFKSAADADSWLSRYKLLVDNPSTIFSPREYICVTVKFLKAAMLLVLHRAAMDARTFVTNDIVKFFKLLQD